MSKISNLPCDGGWYYGRQAFRDWLLNQADELLRPRGARRKNYHASEVREHGEVAARRLIAEGLKREGLRPEKYARAAYEGLRMMLDVIREVSVPGGATTQAGIGADSTFCATRWIYSCTLRKYASENFGNSIATAN